MDEELRRSIESAYELMESIFDVKFHSEEVLGRTDDYAIAIYRGISIEAYCHFFYADGIDGKIWNAIPSTPGFNSGLKQMGKIYNNMEIRNFLVDIFGKPNEWPPGIG